MYRTDAVQHRLCQRLVLCPDRRGRLVRMVRYADDTQLAISGPIERLPDMQRDVYGTR